MELFKYNSISGIFFKPELYDRRKQLLGNNYHVIYKKLDYETKIYPANKIRQKTLVFTILKTCDMINSVDISFTGIISNIKSIAVEYGVDRIDKLGVEDLETQIKTNCAIFGRKITYMNNKIIVPLVMAPFHGTNLVSPSTSCYELQIWVELNQDINDIELYGKSYYIENFIRKEYDFVTIQNTYCGSQEIKSGINNLKICFNHRICLMYFWGFDKSKVTNIKLLIDNIIYYDGSIECLEHNKKYDIEPCMISISSSSDLLQPIEIGSIINFAMVDKAELIITTTQTESSKFYIVGLNLQIMRHLKDMYGLLFI